MEKVYSYSETPQGKSQSQRMTTCRMNLGLNTGKKFYEKYSKGRFSYAQYQKYERGERLLNNKAAMLYASIFGVDWEWLKNGDDDVNYIQKPINKINDINIEHLKNVIICIEKFISETNRSWKPEVKANVIVTIYVETLNEPSEIKIAKIYEFTKLLAKHAEIKEVAG